MRLWLAKPDWQAAEQLAQDLSAELLHGEKTVIDEYSEMKLMALARFYLAKARFAQDAKLLEKAQQLFNTLEQTAMAGGRVQSQMEAAMQKGICLYVMRRLPACPPADEKKKDALKSLEAALAMAEREGYLRLFVGEGGIMAEMLAEIMREKKAVAADPYPAAGEDFISKLLGLLSGGKGTAQPHPGLMLAESLTEREYEVLQLLEHGLSNKEMAKRLFLTEGTVKTHVHNVLGKLGAQSRTHAVARGRELRLL